MLKAIETVYDGYRFRSRLEARWAVFFKTLGIRYEYEKEGYNLYGYSYLPDFWLPDFGCWIEIKGQHPTKEESLKATLLAFHTDDPVFVFYGAVWIPGVDDTYEVPRYGGEVIETMKKGAYGHIPEELSLIVQDTASSCYEVGSKRHDGRDYCKGCGKEKCPAHIILAAQGPRCPLGADEYVSEEWNHLIRCMYIAEALSPHGDSCKLRLDQHGELQYLVPQYLESINERGRYQQYAGRIPAPLPECIREYKQDFEKLLATKPNTYEWGVGAFWPLFNDNVHRWTQCSICGGLTLYGNQCDYSCPEEYKHDDSPNLIAAYTAARQARFEHGERG